MSRLPAAIMIFFLGATCASDGTRALAHSVASNPEAAENQADDTSGAGSVAALKPLACQTLASGDHVIANAKLVGDGTNDCLVISGTANVIIEDSEIVHAATGVRVIGGGKVIIRRNRIHDFSGTGIRVAHAQGSNLDYIGVDLLIQDNEIYDSNTGCASYDVKDWNCRGPRGNGISLAHIKGARVVDNRITNTEFGCLRVVTNAEDTVVKSNYCEGPKYDAGFYFEFAWRGGLVTGNHLSGRSQGSRGMIFTNCREDTRQAHVLDNIVEGFKGPWQMGGCEIVAEGNTIDCDDPSTAAVERGYFGIALNIRRGAGTHTSRAIDNLIKNCQIGIAIGQGAGSEGPQVEVDANSFLGVQVPITGYVFDFRNLWNHAAHQPLIHGSHIIQNNRDSLTQQIVNPQ